MRAPYVLCYHAVSSSWPARLAVSETLLAEQLGFLAARGFQGLTLAEAERRHRSGTLPKRTVVVTFDDAYASTTLAAPLLAELGFPGTVFAVTSFPDSGHPLSWPGVERWSTGEWAAEMAPLGWDELARLQDAGWEIGSHSVSHPRLTEIPDDHLAEELSASRETIIAQLGACETVAYPYGLADERVAAFAERAGYLAGVTLTPAHRTDEPFLRPRMGLNRKDTGLRLRTKLSPAFVSFRRTRLATGAEWASRHLRNR